MIFANKFPSASEQDLISFTPTASSNCRSLYGGSWQDWLKKNFGEWETNLNPLTDSEEMSWREPEVLIRLVDPCHGTAPENLFICHHCSFESEILKLLESHIKAWHIPQLEQSLASKQWEHEEIFSPAIEPNDLDDSNSALQSPVGDLMKTKNEGKTRFKRSLECPNCIFKCAKTKTLKKHLKLKHKDVKPFECHHCKFSTFYPKVLKRHFRFKHPSVQPYTCDKCTFTSYEELELKVHYINEHTNKLVHSCPHCEYISGNCGSLMSHIKVKHPTEEPHQCLQCSVKTSETCGGLEKVKTPEKRVRSEDGRGVSKIHECPHCGYKTPQLAHLKRHIISNHTRERPYKCVHCHYTTARSDHLRKHVVNKHPNENTYHCSLCPFTSPHATDLKLHIKLSHSVAPNGTISQVFKNFTCSQCDYETCRSDNLKRHASAHRLPSKCYQCNYCVFSTYCLEKLKMHMDGRHSNEKYQCFFCDFFSIDPDALQEHIQIHGWSNAFKS